MLPIPAFNPGDTTAYPNGNGMIQVGAADAGSKMLLYNESPFNINIDFLNGSQSILHAWEARYWTLDGDTRQVEWDINSTLNVTSSPISLVIGELYNAGERLEGTYPMGLIRQTNVGNPGGIVSSASTIVNDNNVAGTQIIESTPIGAASSTISILNDGTVTLKGDVAGVLTTLLQLIPGAAAGASSVMLSDNVRKTQVLGLLQVDGTTFVNQIQAFGDLLMQAGTNIRMQQSGLGVNANGDVLGITQAASRYDTHLKTPGGTGTGSTTWLEAGGAQVFKVTETTAEVINGHSVVFNGGGTLSQIGFSVFTGLGSGLLLLTHNFGFVPTAAFWSGGHAANTNPGTTTAAPYDWLANTCRLNNFAAVDGVLLYLKV